MRAVLALLYKTFMSRESRNSLRLMLALEDHDRPPQEITQFPEKRVLVIAPHMDDEIAGVGGTLRLHVEAGASVCVVFATNGCRGCIDAAQAALMSPSERRLFEKACMATRKAESLAACTIIGITDVRFLDGPDGTLKPTEALITSLGAIFTDVVPDVVYHPSLFDLHEDHWQTNCLLGLSMARGSYPAPVRLRGYEVWTPVLANVVIDISRVIDRKRSAFESFISQNVQVEYPRAILGLNAYRSIYAAAGRGYAEAFHETLPAVFQRLLVQAKVRR